MWESLIVLTSVVIVDWIGGLFMGFSDATLLKSTQGLTDSQDP
jgi:hypothetical protein